MKSKLKDLLLALLAVIFSIALMFAFIELPRWIDSLLQQNMGFPGFDQGADESATYRSDLFIGALKLRWVGYGSLILVLFFIVMGFVTRKSSWAWAGAFVIFLPVFGQFALSMFFLSGLGILRAGWLPFMEVGFPVLDLGMVIYIPYRVLIWFFGLFNWYARDFICWVFMATGSFLFVWGVFVWLQSRFGSNGVARNWIYKISRHPQYLGWIIWSYGFMIFSTMENQMKKTWGVATSFPWLIATMIIIAICMIEELAMKEKYGSEYDNYREKTPFLFPLPRWVKLILKEPMRFITKDRFPQSRKQVAGITIIYTIIFMALSLVWVDFGLDEAGRLATVENPKKVIDSITNEIQHTFERRELSEQFEVLGNLEDAAVDPLIAYLSDPDPVKREFATNQLGRLSNTLAVQPLIDALNDENWRVRNSAAIALSNIGDEKAVDPIMELIRNTPPNERSRFFSVLGSLGAEEAWPFLVDGTKDAKWYFRNSAVKALVEINPDNALPFVFEALHDSLYQVRRNAVFILLEQKPQEAIVPLQKVLNDKDFETRFYAAQALKLIEQENN